MLTTQKIATQRERIYIFQAKKVNICKDLEAVTRKGKTALGARK